MSHNTKRAKSAGFTITELITTIVIIGILIIPLSVFTVNYFGILIARNTEAQLAAESQILLRSITEELRTASAVLPATTIDDPNEPPSGWQTSNANLVVIIATPALDRGFNFIIDPLTGMPYYNQIIYYTDQDKLYRRYLANPEAEGNTTNTSCPPTTATPGCPADRLLTNHFSEMVFTLYDQDDNTIPESEIVSARSIIVDVTMRQKAFGGTIDYRNSMRMTMRNKL